MKHIRIDPQPQCNDIWEAHSTDVSGKWYRTAEREGPEFIPLFEGPVGHIPVYCDVHNQFEWREI